MVGVIAAIGIGFAVRRAGISGRSAGNSQVLPGVASSGIGIDVPCRGIDEQPVALLVIAMAGIGRRGRFYCWVCGSPGVGGGAVKVSL